MKRVSRKYSLSFEKLCQARFVSGGFVALDDALLGGFVQRLLNLRKITFGLVNFLGFNQALESFERFGERALSRQISLAVF